MINSLGLAILAWVIVSTITTTVLVDVHDDEEVTKFGIKFSFLFATLIAIAVFLISLPK